MYTNISPTWLTYLIENTPNFILIDIRNSKEFRDFHIKRSILIDPANIIEQVSKLAVSKNTKLVIYDSNNSTSPYIANELLGEGYHNVSILEGGFQQWISENHPIENLNS